MKRTKSRPNRWQDHYTRQAKKDRYPARSVYKLEEIQRKHRIIRKGDAILDLGCAPGAWLLFAARQCGASGRVVGIDLKAVTVNLPGNAQAVTGDLRDLADQPDLLPEGDFDVVLSDMAPATTGSRDTDAARSYYLCEAALAVADQRLKTGGHFVCKIFQGPDSNAFVQMIKSRFARQHLFKPQSSRKASREIFVIGIDKQ